MKDGKFEYMLKYFGDNYESRDTDGNSRQKKE
jgi:hypothetical protein